VESKPATRAAFTMRSPPDGVAPTRRRGMAELVGGEDACSNRFSCSRSAL
jgi:hypothetical protein